MTQGERNRIRRIARRKRYYLEVRNSCGEALGRSSFPLYEKQVDELVSMLSRFLKRGNTADTVGVFTTQDVESTHEDTLSFL
jgi:hypothetical protein